jgi:hypothetical protein
MTATRSAELAALFQVAFFGRLQVAVPIPVRRDNDRYLDAAFSFVGVIEQIVAAIVQDDEFGAFANPILVFIGHRRRCRCPNKILVHRTDVVAGRFARDVF